MTVVKVTTATPKMSIKNEWFTYYNTKTDICHTPLTKCCMEL